MRSFVFTSSLFAFAAAAAAQAPQPKMGAPLNGLTPAQLARFQAGRVDFGRVLSVAEGLGPTFNQQSCAGCHNNPVGGSGTIEVTRFGYFDGKSTFDPLASLGGSLLQANAINIACQEVVPAAANVTANRVTPSTMGLGLVEAIADADIAARETTPPAPGITGRARWVHPLEAPAGPAVVGRMGWKAQVATVLTFSGDASMNELGLTNRLAPTENAPNGNTALLAQWDTVADPEDQLNAQGIGFIDRITDFQRYLAAPPQTPRAGMAGETIFHAVGCANCHVASYTTRNDPALEPAIRNQLIKPYSDFLLHDMGLTADFIGDGDADMQELRTPSLWGMRTRDPLWHDGRVGGGTLQTRVLGPGGIIEQHNAFGSEAQPSALAFLALSQADKLKVVAFLDSLGRAEFDGNGDNARDALDLPGFLQAQLGGPWSADAPQAIYDLDRDGYVTFLDLQAFAQVFEGDCNNNGQNDLLDVVSGASADGNYDLIPDECQTCQQDLGFAGAGTLTLRMCGDALTVAGAKGTFQLSGGPANAPVLIAIGVASNPHPVTATEILVPLEPLAALVDLFATDASGRLRLPIYGGALLPTHSWIFQAATFDGVAFDLSNAVSAVVGGF